MYKADAASPQYKKVEKRMPNGKVNRGLVPRMTSSSREDTGSTFGSSGISKTWSIVEVLSVVVWSSEHLRPNSPQENPGATAVQVVVRTAVKSNSTTLIY